MPRRRRRRSSDMHLPEVYIAASPVDASSPGAEEPELDYFSKTNPDCYNTDGQPTRKPRWRPERAWDTPSATESDKEFESDSESSSSSEDDFDDKDSLACVDLESAAAMRAIEIQAASPRVSLHRASDKHKKPKARRHHHKEQPRQDPMQSSAGAPEMQMGQATMEQMPEAAPNSAQGWMPTCTCSMKMARDCTENLLCCCSEGAQSGRPGRRRPRRRGDGEGPPGTTLQGQSKTPRPALEPYTAGIVVPQLRAGRLREAERR